MIGSVLGFLGGAATEQFAKAAGKSLTSGIANKWMAKVMTIGAAGVGMMIGQAVEDSYKRSAEEFRCTLESAAGLEIVE